MKSAVAQECARKTRWAADDSAGVYKIDMVRMCAERTDEYSNVRAKISTCRNAGAAMCGVNRGWVMMYTVTVPGQPNVTVLLNDWLAHRVDLSLYVKIITTERIGRYPLKCEPTAMGMFRNRWGNKLPKLEERRFGIYLSRGMVPMKRW